MGWIRLALTPEAFHGRRRRRGFFEGWYIKLVSADITSRIALIPGVFLGSEPGTAREAFIQVLDGMNRNSAYHRFPLQQFRASEGKFDVRVGENHFNATGVTLNLPSSQGVPALSGRVDYLQAPQGWPVSWRSPGAMGWYGWLPFLECYHAVVGFGHQLSGELSGMDFTGGRGYIEKDWGQGFPQAHIWISTNHFNDPHMSLMASMAIIPWRGSAFRGFLVGLRSREGFRSFAMYDGARTESLSVTGEHVRWTLVGGDGARLELFCVRGPGGLLAAPVRSEMHHRVEETLDASVRVRLWSPTRKLVVDDTGVAAGLEIAGDLAQLLAMK